MSARPKQQKPVTESGEKLPDPRQKPLNPTEAVDDDARRKSLENARRRYLLARFWLSAKASGVATAAGWPGR